MLLETPPQHYNLAIAHQRAGIVIDLAIKPAEAKPSLAVVVIRFHTIPAIATA
jgi:hypothetical protein